MMRRAIVGTAGHIDHGKTRLVQALTGIDCDRWAEEKRRGITIDLGFAFLTEGDLQLGFIDVPGHEKFVHNALAGLGGIRLMLLVVAADEGVKPQTREHLAICSLLGIPAGLVAVTKSDLVSKDLLELAQLEIDDLLRETPFAGVPILPVSSETGEGVQELRATLIRLAREHESPPESDRPVRLPLDRAFHLKGLGVVITGTMISGSVTSGTTLEVLPPRLTARVRSIQVHGTSREDATAGERTSLQLSGVDLRDLTRGMQLGTPGAFTTSTRLCVRFTLVPDAPSPIRGSVPVRFHLYASESLGRLRLLEPAELEPSATGIAEVRLNRPVMAVRGDRFIVRRPSPQATLGGGEILDPRWRHRRGRPLKAALESLCADDAAALALWTEQAGERGVEAEGLAQRLGLHAESLESALEQLRSDQRLLEVPLGKGQARRWLHPAVYQRVAERARRVLGEYFRDHRMSRGMPKAEAVKRILPARGAELTATYLAWLEAQKILTIEEDRINLPGRTSQLTGEESTLARDILAGFEDSGLTPPSPAELMKRLGAKPQIFDGVVRYLVEQGRLARLPGGLIVASAAIDSVREDLRASGWESFSVPEFKDRFELTRKWAIPILEHLDSTGITRRMGDRRQVVRTR